MDKFEADRLAWNVRRTVGHHVAVVTDGEFFAVQVVHPTGHGNDTYTLCDEADWDWLQPRITG
jgi:hypothetical protein